MLTTNRTLKLLYLVATLLPFIAFNANAAQYKVAEKLQNGDLMINGMAWRPAKACSHIGKGDMVVFKQGNQNGHCVSATIIKDKETKPCQLWCDI